MVQKTEKNIEYCKCKTYFTKQEKSFRFKWVTHYFKFTILIRKSNIKSFKESNDLVIFIPVKKSKIKK